MLSLRIAKALKTARELNKESQTSLAKKMGIKQSYISGIESGDISLTVGQVVKFSKALQCKLTLVNASNSLKVKLTNNMTALTIDQLEAVSKSFAVKLELEIN